jgi:glycosyltransferase involved in cell wall biosynthesis
MNIDVIIPTYNAKPDDLKRCLGSILAQSILDDLYITVVDDASTDTSFYTIIEQFKPLMNISVIRNPVNGGCGVARQFGIDNTHNPLITIIDSDDTFSGAFSLQILRYPLLDNNNHIMTVGSFTQINDADKNKYPSFFLIDENNMTWMHGKMYRRSFIQDNNIRFHPTSRANEDRGFNIMIELIAPENSIVTIPDSILYWQYNENSIVREKNCAYRYGSDKRHAYYGYIENISYIVDTLPDNPKTPILVNDTMMFLYEWFLRMYALSPNTTPQNLIYAKDFYFDCFKLYPRDDSRFNLCQNNINESIKNEIYDKPIMSYDQFLQLLESIKDAN